MGRIHLITGGCRSGKSAYAQRLAEAFLNSRLFIATCPVMDGDHEMATRIEKHRGDRSHKGWQTVEESVNLPEALMSAGDYEVVLIDCLSLWISNLLFARGDQWSMLTEDIVSTHAADLLKAASEYPGTLMLVTNEVGMGIVPTNDMARRYRDLLGRCNQIAAAGADSVTLMVSGIPLLLKGSTE